MVVILTPIVLMVVGIPGYWLRPFWSLKWRGFVWGSVEISNNPGGHCHPGMPHPSEKHMINIHVFKYYTSIMGYFLRFSKKWFLDYFDSGKPKKKKWTSRHQNGPQDTFSFRFSCEAARFLHGKKHPWMNENHRCMGNSVRSGHPYLGLVRWAW